MSDFQKAMMWTAIAAVVLNALGILAGIVAAVIFAVKGKRQIMSGILAGLGIGIVALGASCFAIIAITNV
jgi:ABC-type uncharacterized transport system permease subunit